jgi:hypothetical protein
MSHFDPSLTMLSRREQAILAAVGNAFFPPNGPIPVSGVAAGVVAYFDRYLARSQRMQRVLMRLLFIFIDLSPLTFGPRRRRFTSLDQADRIRLLDGMSKSRIYFRRVSFISIRALMTMAYLSAPEVARAMQMAPNTDPFGIGGRELEEDDEPDGALPGAGEPGGMMMEAAL